MCSDFIKLSQITKIYTTGKMVFTALQGISLPIQKDEFIAIMGPSGSGKSTLMNIIGCLDTVTVGSYLLNGEDISKKIKGWQR